MGQILSSIIDLHKTCDNIIRHYSATDSILVDCGEKASQFLSTCDNRVGAEEVFAGGHEFLVGFVVFVVENFLLEKLPQPNICKRDTLPQELLTAIKQSGYCHGGLYEEYSDYVDATHGKMDISKLSEEYKRPAFCCEWEWIPSEWQWPQGFDDDEASQANTFGCWENIECDRKVIYQPTGMLAVRDAHGWEE